MFRTLKFSLGACLAAALARGVQGQYESIAGYEPGSDVTQHNMLDLDQAEMETHLKGPDFDKAKDIYTLGGNSGATAEITVIALDFDAAKGAEVRQLGGTGLSMVALFFFLCLLLFFFLWSVPFFFL